MKTLVVVLAACGLLLASQRPAQAQVSWGIPFPFLFYNFNQGYQQPQPYYGGQRVYYGQGYYFCPSSCTPTRRANYYQPRYYYGPAWHRATTLTKLRLASGFNRSSSHLVGPGWADWSLVGGGFGLGCLHGFAWALAPATPELLNEAARPFAAYAMAGG